MRHAMLGFCIFAAACSSQPVSPTSPSGLVGVAGTQAQAKGGAANVEVTFTKWVPAFPTLAGVTGGDVPGTLAVAVLSRDLFDNGNIVQLVARYEVGQLTPVATRQLDPKEILGDPPHALQHDEPLAVW